MGKNIWMAFLFFAVVIALSSVASAEKFSGIRYDDDLKRGEEMMVRASARNDQGEYISDARMIVYIPELEVYERSGPFFMSEGMSYARVMDVELPLDAASGEYDVRISLFREGKMKHYWRTFDIE